MKMLIIGVAVLAALWLLWRRLTPPAGMVFDLDDPRMEIAKQTARDTLPEFWAALAAEAAGDSDFGLKFDLNHGRGLPDRELIWATGVTRTPMAPFMATSPTRRSIAISAPDSRS